MFSGPLVFYGLLPFGLEMPSARYWPVPKGTCKTQGFLVLIFLNLWHIFSMAFLKNLLDKFARCNMCESLTDGQIACEVNDYLH